MGITNINNITAGINTQPTQHTRLNPESLKASPTQKEQAQKPAALAELEQKPIETNDSTGIAGPFKTSDGGTITYSADGDTAVRSKQSLSAETVDSRQNYITTAANQDELEEGEAGTVAMSSVAINTPTAPTAAVTGTYMSGTESGRTDNENSTAVNTSVSSADRSSSEMSSAEAKTEAKKMIMQGYTASQIKSKTGLSQTAIDSLIGE